MLNFAKQYCDYYLRRYLNSKGQDLIEYALLLAIVVGIGYIIFSSAGLEESIKAIFDSTKKVFDLVIKMVPWTTRHPNGI